MEGIRKVAVIGAGVMGAGIAAQVANAGIPVLLLDIVPEGAKERSIVAASAIDRMRKTEPAPLMSEDAAKLITAGNIEDHLKQVAECDWIIEAIIERLDAKQELYHRLEAVRKRGSAVSSNTSTIPLRALVNGLPETFRRDFLITHFFNPPRYMRLLEIVAGPDTAPDIVASISRFGDIALGKTIVECKDTPGFIANRLGVYWMQVAVLEAIEGGLTVEEADAVMGAPFGIPRTGIFGLIDLVGLDLMPHVNASMARLLPAKDAFHAANRELPLVQKMIAEGYTGRKGKGGFYRLDQSGGKRRKLAIDLVTGEYRPEQKPELPELQGARDLRALLSAESKVGRYAWRVLGQTLAYAASLVPEAADDIVRIDEAMRLGYNWKWGPFELLDKIGPDWVADRLAAEGLPVPAMLELARGKKFYRVQNGVPQYLGLDGQYHEIVRPEGVLLLSDIKLRTEPLAKNGSAALWDIGDGVACFEFTSKMNALDGDIIVLLEKSIAIVRERFKALVIYNEGENFSVGANLGIALFAANIAAWSEIEKQLVAGQRTYLALKYAPFPVVAAPSGMALGGGCEILLHSAAVQAHAETYAGLVECGVGLVPAWGGCKEMLLRWQKSPVSPRGPMPAPIKAFEMISTAQVSRSAAQAKEMLILRPTDRITMNRARLLADAKARALELAQNYLPPQPAVLSLPGASGKLALMMAARNAHKLGKATSHDLVVAEGLANVLSGGECDLVDECDEQRILDLERINFMQLLRTQPTLARIEHTLETGKPLRN